MRVGLDFVERCIVASKKLSIDHCEVTGVQSCGFITASSTLNNQLLIKAFHKKKSLKV
jgi:hypothetical protein